MRKHLVAILAGVGVAWSLRVRPYSTREDERGIQRHGRNGKRQHALLQD
jgi:hypothetical protein